MRFIEVKAEEIVKNAKKYDGKEFVINYYSTRSKKRCNSIIGFKVFNNNILYYYYTDEEYYFAMYGDYEYIKFIQEDDKDHWDGVRFFYIEDDDK